MARIREYCECLLKNDLEMYFLLLEFVKFAYTCTPWHLHARASVRQMQVFAEFAI